MWRNPLVNPDQQLFCGHSDEMETSACVSWTRSHSDTRRPLSAETGSKMSHQDFRKQQCCFWQEYFWRPAHLQGVVLCSEVDLFRSRRSIFPQCKVVFQNTRTYIWRTQAVSCHDWNELIRKMRVVTLGVVWLGCPLSISSWPWCWRQTSRLRRGPVEHR